MTKLPATFVEADALKFARDFIEWLRTHPEGLFHPNATAVYGKSYMKACAQSHPYLADDILRFADNGSKEACEALRELAAEYAHRNEAAPPAVATYAIRVLKGEPRKHGPGKAEDFLRNIGITWLVALMRQRFPFLALYRNPASHRPTLSSIAADALTKAGIASLSFKGVEKIWDRYLPAFAATPYAIGTKFAAGFPVGYRGLFDG